MKSVVMLFAAILFAVPVLAQEAEAPEATKPFKHYLGVGAGFTTGYGLSYRYWPGKFGIQANFAPIKTEYEESVSAGITFLMKLVEAGHTNFFLYQGNHFHYYKSDYWYYDEWGNSIRDGQSDSYLNNGIGMGIEFIMLKRVSFNVMVGYASYENFERLSLTGETALYFRF